MSRPKQTAAHIYEPSLSRDAGKEDRAGEGKRRTGGGGGGGGWVLGQSAQVNAADVPQPAPTTASAF